MPRKVTLFPRPCDHCGREFLVLPSQVKVGGGRFCGRACYHAHRVRPAPERFWEKVRKTESCWLWTGGTARAGYGTFFADGRLTSAHIYSWELAHGAITDGSFVLHNCPGGDTPACVNPAHLWLGTQKQNMEDCKAKGRTSHYSEPGRFAGEKNAHVKLGTVQVLQIRAYYAAGGVSLQKLADEFGVSLTLVWCIVHRKRWKHVA